MYGMKLKIGKTITAPKNEVVLAYLQAAKAGRGKAEQYFKSHKR